MKIGRPDGIAVSGQSSGRPDAPPGADLQRTGRVLMAETPFVGYDEFVCSGRITL
jgi:hypothetical protein